MLWLMRIMVQCTSIRGFTRLWHEVELVGLPWMLPAEYLLPFRNCLEEKQCNFNIIKHRITWEHVETDAELGFQPFAQITDC